MVLHAQLGTYDSSGLLRSTRHHCDITSAVEKDFMPCGWHQSGDVDRERER